MQVEYIRDLNHNYLVLHNEEDVDINSYQVRMMVTNIIPNMLKCNFRSIDNKVQFYYEITWKQPLSRVFENSTVDFDKLKMILTGVYRAINIINEYLLVASQLILNPEHIYMDIETHEVFFCYYPLYQDDIEHSFHQLMEYILSKLDHNDTEAVVAGYEIYKMTLEDNYSIEKVMETLNKKGNDSNYYAAQSNENNDGNFNYDNFEDNKIDKSHISLHKADKNIGVGKDIRETLHNSKNVRQKMGDAFRGRDSVKKGITNTEYHNPGEKYRKRPEGKMDIRQYVPQIDMKKIVSSVLIMILIAGSVGFIILNEKYYFVNLSTTQLGGILFIILGVVFYIYSWSKKRKSSKEYQDDKMEYRRHESESSSGSDYIINKIKHKNTYIDSDGVIKKRSKAFQTTNPSQYKDNHNIDKQYSGEKFLNNDMLMNSEEFIRPEASAAQYIPDLRTSISKRIKEESILEGISKSALDDELEKFGETSMLLTPDKVIMMSLQSLQPEEYQDILIDSEVTLIGKLGRVVDVVINNPMISRVHAKIERKNNEYYITDLNSTNGTYVNGHEFKANERQLITEKDSITLANVTYIFNSIEKAPYNVQNIY